MKRVVVTGMGAITPLGNDVASFWQAIKEGKSGAAPITRFDTDKLKTKFACEVKQYDPLNYFERQEARKLDLYVQYSLIAVREALGQAAIDMDKLDKTRTSVIWGTGYGGFTTFEQEVSEFARGEGTPRFNPYFITKTIPNMASGIIAIKYGFQGINYTAISACATSNTAIMDALNYIRLGKADMIIAGGAEAAISPAAIGGFSSMKALSTRNDDPATASRPFDVNRDGFVLGEGAGALVLESYEHAVQRGATILAEVSGAAMTCDAYHITLTHPDGEGAYLGMTQALQDAGIDAGAIDYINMHATSTHAGDLSEMKAVQRVFPENKHMKLSATKSMTGHLLGGAGAIEAVICIQSIRDSFVPATINTTTIDGDARLSSQIVLQNGIHMPVHYAMSNTFGFGGHNAIVIFNKASA